MTDRQDATANTAVDEAGGAGSTSSASVEVVVRPTVGGRYQVLGLIGAGAMGTVYRARDRELDEIVALKVLKKELAGTAGMLDRFRREVRLARRVTHRNVARVFDIGDDAGDRFLTMELVEGESLACRLARYGRLPPGEIAALVKDVCAGLAAAHDAGVLHRDLKPDNVIVAKDGRAVITDFGIARAVAESDAKTAVGSFVGTPLYMAPEQVEGLGELDARADLYALGAMMYELITGRPAWQRPSVVAVAAARLLSPPPDPRALVPDLPEPLAELVLRLMARERDDRPSSALEVIQALLGSDQVPVPARPTSVPRIEDDRRKKTVAVLPLDVATDDAWLAYGVVDELTSILARSDDLVIRDAPPLMSAIDRDGRELGRILDVDAVVTGLVGREEDRARVTLRLTTVEDGFQLWVKTFTRPVAEIGLIADQAASAIAEMLSTRAVIPPREVLSATIEERLLKGRYALYRKIGGLSDNSVAILREAHALAPDDVRVVGAFAIALARAYRQHEAADSTEARRIARRALDLDATRPEGRVALGTIHLADGEGEKAAIEMASALRVAPNDVDALDTMGRVLVEAGATDEGLRLIDRALQKQEIILARHLRIRTMLLLGEWDRLFEWMSELPKDVNSVLATALLWVRALTWCPDDEQARAIAGMILGLKLRGPAGDTVARIAEDPRSEPGRAAVRDVLGFAVAGVPSHNPRARALRAQLAVEAALYVGDLPAAAAALREADEAKIFDRLWLDRCFLLEPLRAMPELADVRGNVARRAEAIVATYQRARISSRGRA